MRHVMLDIETLGTGKRAVVVSIAAVEFNDSEILRTKEFKCTPAMVDRQLSLGREVTGGTIAWWLQQSNEAQSTLFCDRKDAGTEELFNFLVELQEFLEGASVWANGPDFDVDIIHSLLGDFGLYAPVAFYNRRCVRTLKCFLPEDFKLPDGLTAHDAKDDCIKQIYQIWEVANLMGKRSVFNA